MTDRSIAALEATRLSNLLNAGHLWESNPSNQALLEEAFLQVQEAHTVIAEWIRDFGKDREHTYDMWLLNKHNFGDVIADVNEVRARHGLPKIKGTGRYV